MQTYFVMVLIHCTMTEKLLLELSPLGLCVKNTVTGISFFHCKPCDKCELVSFLTQGNYSACKVVPQVLVKFIAHCKM